MAVLVTQEPFEVVGTPDTARARVTQLPFEVIGTPATARARVTQLVLEIISDVPVNAFSGTGEELFESPASLSVEVAFAAVGSGESAGLGNFTAEKYLAARGDSETAGSADIHTDVYFSVRGDLITDARGSFTAIKNFAAIGTVLVEGQPGLARIVFGDISTNGYDSGNPTGSFRYYVPVGVITEMRNMVLDAQNPGLTTKGYTGVPQ